MKIQDRDYSEEMHIQRHTPRMEYKQRQLAIRLRELQDKAELLCSRVPNSQFWGYELDAMLRAVDTAGYALFRVLEATITDR